MIYTLLCLNILSISGCYANCESKVAEQWVFKSQNEQWTNNIQRYRINVDYWNTSLFDIAEAHFNQIKRDVQFCNLDRCEGLWSNIAFTVHNGQQLDDSDVFGDRLTSAIIECLTKLAYCDDYASTYIKNNECEFNCSWSDTFEQIAL